MTANQLQYHKLQEDIRHNLQQDRYWDRSAGAAEETAAAKTKRENTRLIEADIKQQEATTHKWAAGAKAATDTIGAFTKLVPTMMTVL